MTYSEPTNEQNVVRKYGILRLVMMYNEQQGINTLHEGMKSFQKELSKAYHFVRADHIRCLYNVARSQNVVHALRDGWDCMDFVKVLIDHRGDVSYFRYIESIDISDNKQKQALCEFCLGIFPVYNPRASHFFKVICDKLGIEYTTIHNRVEEKVYDIWLKLITE